MGEIFLDPELPVLAVHVWSGQILVMELLDSFRYHYHLSWVFGGNVLFGWDMGLWLEGTLGFWKATVLPLNYTR